MHYGRRLNRRPPRRRRILLTMLAACVAVFLFFVILYPSSASPEATGEPAAKRDVLKAPVSPAPDNTAIVKPSVPVPPPPTQRPHTTQGPTETLTPSAAPSTPTQTAPALRNATDGPTQTPTTAMVAQGGDIANITTTTVARTDGLYAHYASELRALEAVDMYAPRPGEARVDFATFARCLGTMLDVDPVARTESPRPDATDQTTLPLLISVTAGNTQDLKAMICNLSVPYKYVVLAQNGATPEMTPLFDLLGRVFSFTQRLVVLQFADSVGFAGAVNAGLREALRHPFDEVPFVHIVHNDLRYTGTALQQSIKEAYAATLPDASVVAALEAEVKTEPNDYTPLIRQPTGLRAPLTAGGPLPQLSGRSSVLVTAPLLPDRVRYMRAASREQMMSGRTSFIFHNSRGHYTGAYLSRLAIVTVGFFDENFYPIMFEDTDYRWRAHMLGFTEQLGVEFDGVAVAFDLDCTNTKIPDDVDGRGGFGSPLLGGLLRQTRAPSRPTLSPASRALMRECPSAFQRGVQYQYMVAKWGVETFAELAQASTVRQPYSSEAFSGKRHLPLDAWVVHTPRIADVKRLLRDTGAGGFALPAYSPDVILEAL